MISKKKQFLYMLNQIDFYKLKLDNRNDNHRQQF